MLILKRMTVPYEVRKCDLTGNFLVYGDYYYEDDIDGKTISAIEYKKLQQEEKNQMFDYSLIEQAESEKEYRELMKRAQKDYLRATILDRPVFDQGHCKHNGLE